MGNAQKLIRGIENAKDIIHSIYKKLNTSVETKSLFSTFRLDEVEMLRPTVNPRPYFKYKMLPNVRPQAPDDLKAQGEA